ncbi:MULTISPECIES: carbohydrate ABC transporter permease [unclassified Roseitalea]|uniref:carbohydrate ABC transporter permease n=1 Tax=unclassified Roseitalea TaxID=2639107 RepID=UPI00273E703E|nr:MULTISPECIES: carbohydrate ABC transporter permease [unclassified Roseitalea]
MADLALADSTASPADRLAVYKAQLAGQRATDARKWPLYLAYGAVIVFFVLPLAYLLSVSFKTPDDVLSGRFLPTEPTLANWPAAFGATDLDGFILNSVIASLSSAALTMAIAVPATYAMVRLNTGGRFLPTFTLATYMAPPVVALIPLFFLLRYAGLLHSLPGLIVVYGLMNVPVAFWLLTSFVRALPREIDEAAWIDGAGTWTTLWRIVVPLIAPGLAASFIICAVLAYNEFLFAFFFTTEPSRTLTIGIALFQGERLVNFGQMAAASVAGLVPVYVVAVLAQRWLVSGLVSGGVK